MTEVVAPPPSFAQQRIVFVAMLFAMTFYAICASVMLQQNEGKGLAEQPIDALDTASVFLGFGLATAAMVVRQLLHRRAARLPAGEQGHAMFRATLVPLAMLEGGCFLGLTTWMLNGEAVPPLVVALVLLSLAVLVTPFTDPTQRTGI